MSDSNVDEAERAAQTESQRAVLESLRTRYEVTRLLGAQAYLGGRTFTTRVLHFFHHKSDAVAPELGLDVRLLTQICLAAERMLQRYDVVFACITAEVLIGYLMEQPAMIALGLALAAGTNAGLSAQVRQRAQRFTRERFDYDACVAAYSAEAIPDRIAQALPRHDQNLVLYCGFTPFVGSGGHEAGWSFSCALKPLPDLAAKNTPKPFSAADLYARIKVALASEAIPGLQSVDRVFVRGKDARGTDDLCAGPCLRPLQSIAPARMAQTLNANTERMRHYLCLHVTDWGGEIVTTFHLRFVVRGNGLYVEFNRFFLGPVAERFRTIDKLSNVGLLHKLGGLGLELITGPLVCLLGTFHLLKLVLSTAAFVIRDDTYTRSRRQRIAHDAEYDYGASSSLREGISERTFRHYFQRSDEDFISKFIERKLLDEIADFLEAHGLDNADIRERRTTILNNGIIVHGGNVQAEALAVGPGAKANHGHRASPQAAG